jgi:hypothetical protein
MCHDYQAQIALVGENIDESNNVWVFKLPQQLDLPQSGHVDPLQSEHVFVYFPALTMSEVECALMKCLGVHLFRMTQMYFFDCHNLPCLQANARTTLR